jgi:uncharacterized membrane-anchored protein YitT (DUF2179 family)
MREKIDRKKLLKNVGYWVVLNIGTLLLAGGVYFFKAPNNFATGGVSGLSIILNNYIPFLTQSEIMLIINVLLLIIGFIFLGKGCTFKTAYCSIVYSLEMWLMQYLPISLPLTGQTFLEFVYAMMLTGIGSAIIFNCKASSGGTDIVALIIKKYTKIDVGKALLVTDILIASSTFFIFGVQTGLYSILGLFFKAFLVDSVIENIGKNKYVTIVTEKPDLITPYILEGIHRGFTKFEATGGYTGEKKTVIMTVCKRAEAQRLKLKINDLDPEAFVIFTDTNEILGKGFRETID